MDDETAGGSGRAAIRRRARGQTDAGRWFDGTALSEDAWMGPKQKRQASRFKDPGCRPGPCRLERDEGTHGTLVCASRLWGGSNEASRSAGGAKEASSQASEAPNTSRRSSLFERAGPPAADRAVSSRLVETSERTGRGRSTTIFAWLI